MTTGFISGSMTERLKNNLRSARKVTVLTGAGISAESGVPTFRGPGGLWENHRPEDLATPEAFEKDPALVWRWYNWRRELIASCKPNPAHLALADLEKNTTDFSLITQNVDGLHRLAGSLDLIEMHGSIWRVKCTGCQFTVENRNLDLAAPAKCPECGGFLRPDVVWFGEMLDQNLLERAWLAAQEAEVMLVIGTSSVVQPAAGLALSAKTAGAFVAEINLEPTPNSDWVDACLLGKAGEILPALLEEA